MQIYVYNGTTKHNLIGAILDNGTPLFNGGENAELPISDSSYRYSEIMGDDDCVLNFSLPVFVEFPIGSKINVENTEYTLLELGNITKQNLRRYDYSLTFESPAKQLSRYKLRNYVDGRLNFTVTAKPLEFLFYIINNLNQREGGNEWQYGDCIVASEKTQSFSHNTCLDALNEIAALFETEWEIVNKTISLKKVEYNKANPITLSYGKGNGFKSGISRQLSDEKAVDVVWVEGGDRNIDSQTYTYDKEIEGQTQTLHSSTLRLPRNAQFIYIPSDNIPDEQGIISQGTLFSLAQWNALLPSQRAQYTEHMQVYTDADGFGVFRQTFINNGYEESLEATDIYPKKVLTVTSVTESNPTKHFFEIKASANDVDYSQFLIGGEQATIIFESGMLTGKEFNWSKYTHATKQFDIVPAEIDGITMPDRPSGYLPTVGDTFAVFHVSMPQSYITAAEQELLLTACEYLWKHGEVEVEFNGTIDGIWSKKNWDALVPYFKIGGYINFTDNAFCQDGKKMRILSVKTYLNNPHSPEITLSNSSVSQGITSELKKIPQNQVSAKNDLQQQIFYTERSFRDTKETQKALEEAIENIDDTFTESISPVSVQTMQMVVGSENLQFAFGTATTTPEGNKQKVTGFNVSTWNPTYNNGTLVCLAADLKHYTIASSEVSSAEKAVSQYPYWSVSAANIIPPDPNKLYYLYVVCPKTGTEVANLGYLTSAAYFTIADSPQAHTAANYFMLVGILNKEREGSRSFATMYGFTEITGNRITTDRIVSSDGNTFFDLVNGEIRGNIIFTAPSGSENKSTIDTVINNNTKVVDLDTSTSAIRSAISGTTEVSGGLMLTNVILLKNSSNVVNAGVSGLNSQSAGKNPRFWAGGNYTQALNAAADSDEDIPTNTVPILLTDQGYNSNIGIFKVLDGAIAVMRDGQVVRISTDTYTNEKEYVPIAPVTRTLATGKQVTLTTSNYTGASTTWNIGTFPKTGNFDVTIPSIAISCSLDENRTMYTTGSVTCSLSVIIVVTAGSKSTTILNSSISVTNTATSGAIVGFTNTGTLNTTARTLSKTRGTSGQNITLKMTVSTSVTGSGGAVSTENSYAKTNAALAVTVSQNQSCFILADGGFACAQSSSKSLMFDAASGTFDYNGSTFKVNGRDFLNSKGQTVTTGSGYVQLSRIGQVVTCKLNIPKSSLSTSAIIPSGYRPTIAVETVCTTGNSSTAYLVTIGSNGSITSSALPNNSVAYGVVSYVTADSYPS